ncbi:DUF3772 domain-containing protein [Solirhodobacter olei]|uniref:DUF3772 domain-containing protein n=1 Tax=Solirhodobacter olei TaxID=2493082 RepID=UPI000FD86217|nr:DUF3772 domain-containing protein [Solirhodobacter olei]
MGRLVLLLRAALLLLLAASAPAAVPGLALAQTQNQQHAPNYKAWETFADKAEKAIANPDTSNLALDMLRRQVVDWRSQFQAAQNANKTQIATLQSQISALGPPPAKGTTEAPEIADRRKKLNDQLATLQAPGLAADEAFTRADGIVREIDNVARQRQAAALMHLGPTPLNPATWPAALALVTDTASTVWTETSQAWSSPFRRAELGSAVPVILLYLALAALLLARGRRWLWRLLRRLSRKFSDAGQEVAAHAASILQVAVSIAGVLAVYGALLETGLFGLTGLRILHVMAVMGGVIFVALWLGAEMFPRGDGRFAVLELSADRRREGRFHAGLLGVLVALDMLRQVAFHGGPNNDAANAVLAFPILVLAGFSLVRLARLLKRHVQNCGSQDETAGYRHRLTAFLSRGLMVIGIGGPVFAAIGYRAAATAVILPAAVSVALIAFLVVAQRITDASYRWIARAPAGEDGGLVPVLIGFVLTVLSLPVFALIWGARVADLAELWMQFAQGFQIGSTHISPANFLTFAILFAVGYGITRLVQGGLRSSVLPRTRIDVGGRNAITVGVGYLGIVLSALVAITGAGIDLSGLAIVAGALTVGIGFGLQNIVSNFVSGVILLIERPVGEGDWIEVGGVQGTVRSISVRSTRIETFDRADVIVPNSNLITGTVTNMTKFSRIGRLIVPVGVAYGTDTRHVDKVLREIAEAHPLVVLNPKPQIVFTGFGADALSFEMRVILRDINFVLDVKTELNHQIAERFAQEGFEIPFAQRDIWLRNPEALRGEPPAPKTQSVASGPRPEPEEPGALPRFDPDLDGDTDAER